jgi:hypothetical protein
VLTVDYGLLWKKQLGQQQHSRRSQLVRRESHKLEAFAHDEIRKSNASHPERVLCLNLAVW